MRRSPRHPAPDARTQRPGPPDGCGARVGGERDQCRHSAVVALRQAREGAGEETAGVDGALARQVPVEAPLEAAAEHVLGLDDDLLRPRPACGLVGDDARKLDQAYSKAGWISNTQGAL